jgi:integrase/recombinase XerD
MTDKAIGPLRQRLIEDMTIRRLGRKTQHDYIRHVGSFADFVGRAADKATAEDVHRYQLQLASIGTTVPTVNASASAKRFFFKVTLKRRDLAAEVVSAREPRRLPVVLSPEEVGRLLGSTVNIKQRAALSLAYATGLRASEVISLKLTDIDSDRMVIRVEQGKSLPPRRLKAAARDADHYRGRPQAPRRPHRAHRRAAHLGISTDPSSHTPISSYPAAASHPTPSAGLPADPASSCPSEYSHASSAACSWKS